MSPHTQHPYRTQRGPQKTDWLLVAFVAMAWAYVMHTDHMAEYGQHQAEQATTQHTHQHAATHTAQHNPAHPADAQATGTHTVATATANATSAPSATRTAPAGLHAAR